jgi:hypothetical protein
VNAESTVKALAGLRIVIGVAAWLAPRQSGKGFGLDPGASEQAPPVAAGLVFAPAIAAVGLGLAALNGAGAAPE